MERKLRALIAVSFALGMSLVFADDSFLQKPFKSYIFESKTYPEGVQELSRIIQKPVIIPDGVTDFVKEINGWSIGARIPWWIRIGRGNQTPTMRDVLDQTSTSLGMGWTYDKAKDEVVMDFSWRRPDPRSASELVQVLLNSPSSISMADERYYWDHHALAPNDVWQIAFDALSSKPENSSAIWKIRFADEMKRSITPSPAINLFSGKIKDQVGNDRLIIVDDQPAFMNPGEGTICYYVFNLDGKFEQGGVYGSGWRCHDASAWVEPSGQKLTLRVFFNDAQKMDQNFILTEKGLFLLDVVDDGMQSILGSDASLMKGLHMGISPFHVAN